MHCKNKNKNLGSTQFLMFSQHKVIQFYKQLSCAKKTQELWWFKKFQKSFFECVIYFILFLFLLKILLFLLILLILLTPRFYIIVSFFYNLKYNKS